MSIKGGGRDKDVRERKESRKGIKRQKGRMRGHLKVKALRVEDDCGEDLERWKR